MSTAAAQGWLRCVAHSRAARLRLFCLPYAGGSSSVFRAWAAELAPEVAVCAFELPGHGTRLRETPVARLEPLIDGLVGALAPWLDLPFAVFGHSMGGMLAVELAHQLARRGLPGPDQLLVAGAGAPQPSAGEPPAHQLSDPALTARLRRLNGTPESILGHPELMRILLPVIRADLAVIETGEFSRLPLLDCPVTVFAGSCDAVVPRHRTLAWREHTRGPFALHVLQGDHFFIHSAGRALRVLVARTLAESLGAPDPVATA